MTENIHAELISTHEGYRIGAAPSTSAAEVAAGRVVAMGDGALLVRPNGADFFFRLPDGGNWSYRHSYGSPRRPSDTVRYLKHGLKCMREICPDWGNWEDGPDV